MSTIEAQRLFAAYDATGAFLENQWPEKKDDFQTIQNIFEDKRYKPDACIMVYGVFNAGKSSLINALLSQAEAAPTADIPLTDAVRPYAWDNYTILDTPGINAPIEHEAVTMEQMRKADAVIFVINPLGTIEERGTIEKLVYLHAEGKKIFMVLNDKKGLGAEDFIRLKDRIRMAIQNVAAQRSMGDILKDVDIVLVNAKSALKARLENKKALLEASGYPEFENKLRGFLSSITNQDIYIRLRDVLLKFIQGKIEILKSETAGQSLSTQVQHFLSETQQHKSTLKADLQRTIGAEQRSIANQVRSILHSGQTDGLESRVQKVLEQSQHNLKTFLDGRISAFAQVFQNDLNTLKMQMPAVEISNPQHALATVPDLHPLQSSDPHISVDTNKIQQASDLLQPQNLQTIITTGATFLPSIMKGLGSQTMSKWAGAMATKWLPYIGTAITIISTIKDYFDEQARQERMREQIQEHNRAIERQRQQIEDFARETADGFERFMSTHLMDEVDKFFAQINTHTQAMLKTLGENESQRAARIEALYALEQQTLAA